MDTARLALRSMRRTPGLGLAVVAVLSLGITASVALFAVADPILFRVPLGVDDAKHVVRLYVSTRDPVTHRLDAQRVVDDGQLDAIDKALAGVASVAGYLIAPNVPLGASISGAPVTVNVVTAKFFSLLGATTQLGRLFIPSDVAAGTGARYAVISVSLWKRQFGGDTAIVGKTMVLRGTPLTVLGVVGGGFRGIDVDAADVWLLRRTSLGGPALIHPVVRPIRHTPAQQVGAAATAALRAVARTRNRDDSTTYAVTGSIINAWGPVANRPEIDVTNRLAAIALVLLAISCANAANLLLARGIRRRHELAILAAVGASPRRIFEVLMAEAALLALAAGAIGFMAGRWVGGVLRLMLFPDVHWRGQALDYRLLGFTAVAVLATCVLSGIAPAWQSARSDLATVLRAGPQADVHRSRLRNAFLVVQTALSVLLLVGAGLVLRSLGNAGSIELGYDRRHLIFASLFSVEADGLYSRMTQVAEDLAGVPGVDRVAITTRPPFTGISFVSYVSIPGRDSISSSGPDAPSWVAVSPGYFETMGMRLISGRTLNSTDRALTAPVVVVDTTMAAWLWPGERSTLGKCVRFVAGTSPCYTIVGVVAATHRFKVIETPAPQVFFAAEQIPFAGELESHFVIRTRDVRGPQIQRLIEGKLRAMLPTADILIRSIDDLLAADYRPWRVAALLFSIFGALALCLAVGGVFGAVSFTVRQRIGELAVRSALGARRRELYRVALAGTATSVGIGLALGLALSYPLSHALSSLLVGVSGSDPVVAVAGAVALVAAVTASLIPLRKAVSVDPATCLRAQ